MRNSRNESGRFPLRTMILSPFVLSLQRSSQSDQISSGTVSGLCPIVSFTFFHSLSRMDQRKSYSFEEKRKDQQEGIEYKRLAEQYALEQIEVDRFRKLNQKEVKTMYDQALEDKNKIKQIEQEMDEVRIRWHFFLSCNISSVDRLGRRRRTACLCRSEEENGSSTT
jgi:hypothetical protein